MKQSKDIEQLVSAGIAHQAVGKYREAMRCYEEAASLGSAQALFLAAGNVRNVFAKPQTTVCSGLEALEADADYRQFDYYYRSAERGYPPAMLCVAKIYAQGGALFDPNPAKAVFWYTRALRNGEEAAREALALCYENGVGVDKNLETAEKIRSGASNF